MTAKAKRRRQRLSTVRIVSEMLQPRHCTGDEPPELAARIHREEELLGWVIAGPQWFLQAIRLVVCIHDVVPGVAGDLFLSDLSDEQLAQVEAWADAINSPSPEASV